MGGASSSSWSSTRTPSGEMRNAGMRDGMGCDGEEQLGLGFELSWAGVGRSREGGTKVRQVVEGGYFVNCRVYRHL